jgi:hypothetical protein
LLVGLAIGIADPDRALSTIYNLTSPGCAKSENRQSTISIDNLNQQPAISINNRQSTIGSPQSAIRNAF